MKYILTILLTLMLGEVIAQNGNIVVSGFDSTTGRAGYKYTLKPTRVTSPLILLNDTTIAITLADSTHNGYLSAVDWNRFNLSIGDTTFRWSVLDSLSTPPGSPATGDIYEVSTVPTGVWVGHAKAIATWGGAAWTYEVPNTGDLLYRVFNDLVSRFSGSVWVRVGKAGLHNGGDSYAASISLGPNDNNSLTFKTNNVGRIGITAAGSVTITNLSGTGIGLVTANSGVLGRIAPSNTIGKYLTGYNTYGTLSDSIALSVWSKNGNAGITPVTNFLGTTDSKTLRFRTNNVERMSLDSADGFLNLYPGASPKDAIRIYRNSNTATSALTISVIADEPYFNAANASIIFKNGSGGGVEGFRVTNFTPSSIIPSGAGFPSAVVTGAIQVKPKFPTGTDISAGINITGIGDAARLLFGIDASENGVIALANADLRIYRNHTSPGDLLRIFVTGNTMIQNVGTFTEIPSSRFTVNSTTQGILPPRMTKTQRDAISSPVAGLMIWQTDNTPGLRVYNGTNWMKYTEATD